MTRYALSQPTISPVVDAIEITGRVLAFGIDPSHNIEVFVTLRHGLVSSARTLDQIETALRDETASADKRILVARQLIEDLRAGADQLAPDAKENQSVILRARELTQEHVGGLTAISRARQGGGRDNDTYARIAAITSLDDGAVQIELKEEWDAVHTLHPDRLVQVFPARR